MSTSSNKRKIDNGDGSVTKPGKRIKITANLTQNASKLRETESLPQEPSSLSKDASSKRRKAIRKLAPRKPFPSVSPAVSATGPRSAHVEGKNYICITRKTPLGSYMRRCKDMILKDGYKTLHMSAMGAAIPQLVKLSTALPPILPFHASEFTTEITTGSCEVYDEVIPEDDQEEEEASHQTRCKSTLMIILKIGNGERETRPLGKSAGKKVANVRSKPTEKNAKRPTSGTSKEIDIFNEPDQGDMEVI